MNHLFRSQLVLLFKSNSGSARRLFSSNSPIQLSQEIPLSKSATTLSESTTTLSESATTLSESSTTLSQSSTTHPSQNNITERLIGCEEIRLRQSNLIKLIDKCSYHKHKSSLVLISSCSRQLQADTKIPTLHFKQNSDFIYLTGFTSHQSSDCVLAIVGGNGVPVRSVLFAPFVDMSQELWEGQDIREHSLWINGICDDLRDLSQLDQFIGEQNGNRHIFVSRSGLSNGNGSANNTNSNESVERLTGHLSKLSSLSSKSAIQQVSPFIEQLRVTKSKSECEAMRRVCRIGSQAMLNTMKWTKSMSFNNLINESQIAAKFEFETRMNGARKLSFPTVCGSGHRSTIIHYGCNDKFSSANDWVLTDGGCEDVDGYNSDITRTWPINGNFKNHRLRHELYEALCEVQKDLISAISADPMMSLDLLFRLMCTLLGKVLMDFKVLDITLSAQEAATLAYRFCPHHVSHYLGLDVHDCPTMSRNIPLKPGMCFTVEPGLYFHKSHIIKPEFKGIGMRVEDDLLLNYDNQLEVLTKDCPHMPNLL